MLNPIIGEYIWLDKNKNNSARTQYRDPIVRPKWTYDGSSVISIRSRF